MLFSFDSVVKEMVNAAAFANIKLWIHVQCLSSTQEATVADLLSHCNPSHCPYLTACTIICILRLPHSLN